ncbi:MAG: glycosyltransferase family 4 protein [Chthoniobacterales bacterium]
MKSSPPPLAGGIPDRIILVKYGSFSHVNSKVERALREQFPGYDLEVVDAARDILASFPLQSLWLRFNASVKRLVPFLRGRHSPWDFVFQEPQAWELISSWILRNVDPAEVAFIFQTQSMFDASHPGIPFFIYTDHTREAHKRQPGGGSPAPASPKWIRLEAALYRKATTVFTLSRFCAESVVLDYGVPEERVLTVSTGINMDLPLLEESATTPEPVILFVGSEWGIKGGEELAAAFKLVRQKMPSAELWVVGAQPPVIQEGMRVFGRVKLGDLDRLFRKASLVCVPSRVERASMLALDAAAYGLPVITTPFGAGAERVRAGVTGLLVDPRNTEEFASAIVALLQDQDRARVMGSAGRTMVEKEFTWDAVGGKIAARIRSLLPVS